VFFGRTVGVYLTIGRPGSLPIRSKTNFYDYKKSPVCNLRLVKGFDKLITGLLSYWHSAVSVDRKQQVAIVFAVKL